MRDYSKGDPRQHDQDVSPDHNNMLTITKAKAVKRVHTLLENLQFHFQDVPDPVADVFEIARQLALADTDIAGFAQEYQGPLDENLKKRIADAEVILDSRVIYTHLRKGYRGNFKTAAEAETQLRDQMAQRNLDLSLLDPAREKSNEEISTELTEAVAMINKYDIGSNPGRSIGDDK